MRRTTWVIVVVLVCGAQPAWAARMKVHEMAESPQYGRKLFGMVGRGALNVVTCPVDVIVNTVNETRTGQPLVGTMTGLGKGLGCGVLRLGSGAVDLVTFWVPGFNGFAISDSYENCMAPAAFSPAVEQLPPSYGQPASTWEAPATESGAEKIPVEPKPKPKKTWTK